MKRSTSPPHPAQPCEGEGKGGCFLWNPEDLLNKKMGVTVHLNYHQKHIENYIFLKTSETNKFLKIFFEAFLI
jgi:hypothetical protein